jgi:serine phosphatase RsbU (regulator of sigma subunit)
MIIDLPPVPRFNITAEQRAMMNEIARASTELGQNAASMSSEARAAAEGRIAARQNELQRALDKEEQRFAEEMAKRNQKLAESRLKTHPPVPAAPATAPTPATLPTPAVASAAVARANSGARIRKLTAEEKERMKKRQKDIALLFGRRFQTPLKKEGAVVGQLTAQVRTEEVIKRVLGASGEDDIAFAVDREGNIYTRTDADRQQLEKLGIAARVAKGTPVNDIENWIVAMQKDEESGLRVGVARPVGENLVELRKTAARNFGWGIGLVALALIGIVPFANHISGDVKLVMEGAERISHGDLMTRLPVKSENEFGQLAVAFNRMAEDLSLQQQRLVVEERTRKEQEIQQRILALEYERKSEDLEEARRFQLSMLPKEVPRHERFDVAVFTQTATEVGGDYYDFHVSPEGVLSVTMGDATGHGARAGTMVTIIKTLFSGYASTIPPSQFLGDAAEKIKRMELGRMAMALSVAKFEPSHLTIASAGMPPVLVHRAANKEIEEVVISSTPLGTLGVDYDETDVRLESGDTVLMLTDGFPELLNPDGQQLGYVQALEEFAAAAVAGDAASVIASLSDAARRWHGDLPPNDDITFVVVRVS